MAEQISALALAWISTSGGQRWIVYHGPGCELTLEAEDGSEKLGLTDRPKNIDDALRIIEERYGAEEWDLHFIEDDDA